MWSRTALVFLLVFVIAMRASSALSLVSHGAPMSALWLFAASSLSGIAAFAWYARQATLHTPAVRRHNDRWVAAH